MGAGRVTWSNVRAWFREREVEYAWAATGMPHSTQFDHSEKERGVREAALKLMSPTQKERSHGPGPLDFANI
eukprot:9954-Eustigmatos_ZCMA.PRE.1